MTRYDWPRAPGSDGPAGRRDDPAARARFNGRYLTGLGSHPDDALAASRTPRAPAPAGRRGTSRAAPRAPASGPMDLWQPLGPLVVIGGQAEGVPRVSGRVNAIQVHTGGQRVYAASANGGVWYSSDGGSHWKSIGGFAATNTEGIVRPAQRNACGALLVEFGDVEGDDLVFLGTGEVTHEMTGGPGDSEGGVGILVGNAPANSSAADPWVREAKNLVGNGVYRIVKEPGGTTVIAATRDGLYQRPASPAADVDWERPDSDPFDSLEARCTDLLWTDAAGGRPARLWVWVETGDDFGLWVRDEGQDDFTKVEVDAASPYVYPQGRGELAASNPPTQVWVLADAGNTTTSPALFRVTNPVTGPTRPKAVGVTGVPNVLRDSGFYNLAIAVDPSNANRVAVAGSFLGDPNDPADALLLLTPDGASRVFDASIVVAVVAPDPANGGKLAYGLPAAPFRMIGLGVHPDVHALEYSNSGATLWTGCDGGVFRSDSPLTIAGFHPRNQGLSISESNFLACHPVCEGHVIAGLQDNGVVMRRSNGVWDEVDQGDGGGVFFDAVQTDRWAGQYVQGTWTLHGSPGSGPLLRGELAQTENDFAAFYSTAACISHVRTGTPSPFSQMLIGTHRPWYSDDFGVSWVTLPTGSDPLPASVAPTVAGGPQQDYDTDQDSLTEGILACRWQDPDTAWVLVPSAVYRLKRTAGSHNGGGPGAWTKPLQPLLQKNVKNKDDFSDAEGPVRKSLNWTDILPNVLPAPPGGDPIGALYLGGVGHPDDEDVDTLWWFDGAGQWFPTGLRRNAVPAPVIAIAVDPDRPDEVWVGTTVGVWHGVRTQPAGEDPTWTWTQFVNGLPEAAVEDLAIFHDGTLRLLRAAIAARGVWELRLDQAVVQPRTYVRVHDDDLRHRLPSPMVARDGTAPRSWHGSPDVRPRIAPVAVPAPATLPWRRDTAGVPTEQLRRFQAALRASTDDPRVVANGRWDAYFSEVLRDLGAPTVPVAAAPPLPAFDQVQIDSTFWDAHMTGDDATAEPWGDDPPTEADLHEYAAGLSEGSRASTSCELRAGPFKVDVVVHHRGMDPRDGAEVRVTLLRWIDPSTPRVPFTDSTTWLTAPVPWTDTVNQVMNSADGALPFPLTDGWSFAGSTDATRRVTLDGQSLDPLHAGVATFDVDLTGVDPDTVVLFVAVIRAGTTPADDLALAAGTLEQLALANPQVAVRSMRVQAP